MTERRERFDATALPLMRNVFAAALRLCGQREAAEDATQETYLRAYRTFDGFEPGTDCKAWLMTILHSVLVNRFHYQRRHPEAALEELAPDSQALAMEDPVLMAVIHQAPSPDVEAALAALPESFRAAVVLVDIEELSYEEAARALQVPVGTIRSRLARGRRRLFDALQHRAARVGSPAPSEREP